MINKKDLYTAIDMICQDILDRVIAPICQIGPGIWADLFLANISCYTQGDENEEEAIFKKICERYGLDSLTKTKEHIIIETGSIKDNFISPIGSYWSLASIALYIIFHGKRSKFYKIEECDFCGKRGSLIVGPYDNLICLDCADKFIKEN